VVLNEHTETKPGAVVPVFCLLHLSSESELCVLPWADLLVGLHVRAEFRAFHSGPFHVIQIVYTDWTLRTAE
jgi:hypothetical protein